jgi:hypothetical protein
MIDFVWCVPTAGYRWCRQRGGRLVAVADDANEDPAAREFLVPITDGKFRDSLPDDASEEALFIEREYSPLEKHTGLFREFAATKRTRAGVRAFANRFGNLGAEYDALGVLDDRDDSVEAPPEVETMEDYAEWLRTAQGEYRRADTRACWMREIERMRRCVAAWDAARAGDTERMAEVVKVINNALFENGVGAGLVIAPTRRGRIAHRFVPVSLLGAMWSQFAQAVAGDRDYRQCEQCGRWYALDPDTARKSRLYCGDACKARHYRARKSKARELRAAGRPLGAIAAELKTDTTTLKRWL